MKSLVWPRWPSKQWDMDVAVIIEAFGGGRVCYMCMTDKGAAEAKERIVNMCQGIHLDPKTALENITFRSVEKKNPSTVK